MIWSENGVWIDGIGASAASIVWQNLPTIMYTSSSGYSNLAFCVFHRMALWLWQIKWWKLRKRAHNHAAWRTYNQRTNKQTNKQTFISSLSQFDFLLHLIFCSRARGSLRSFIKMQWQTISTMSSICTFSLCTPSFAHFAQRNRVSAKRWHRGRRRRQQQQWRCYWSVQCFHTNPLNVWNPYEYMTNSQGESFAKLIRELLQKLGFFFWII